MCHHAAEQTTLLIVVEMRAGAVASEKDPTPWRRGRVYAGFNREWGDCHRLHG